MRYVRTYFVTSRHITQHHRISPIFFSFLSFYHILFIIDHKQNSKLLCLYYNEVARFVYAPSFFLASPSTFYSFFPLFISLQYFSNLPFSVLQFTLTGFLTTLCLFLFLFSSLLHMLYYSFTLPTLLSLSILFKRNDRVY